jgi:hypothetical protein
VINNPALIACKGLHLDITSGKSLVYNPVSQAVLGAELRGDRLLGNSTLQPPDIQLTVAYEVRLKTLRNTVIRPTVICYRDIKIRAQINPAPKRVSKRHKESECLTPRETESITGYDIFPVFVGLPGLKLGGFFGGHTLLLTMRIACPLTLIERAAHISSIKNKAPWGLLWDRFMPDLSSRGCEEKPNKQPRIG